MSSGEIDRIGPMDLHDNASRQALVLQSEAQGDMENFGDIRLKVHGLDDLSPIVNQKAQIIGPQLGFVVEEQGISVLAAPVGTFIDQGKGTYQGFDLCMAYDARVDAMVPLAVHILKTHESVTHEPLGDIILRYHRSLFSVQNTVVEPTDPINAHSYRDIRDDPVISQLGRVLFSKGISHLKKLKAVANLTNEAMAQNPFDHASHHRRVSYLNSLSLLKDVTLIADEAVVTRCNSDGNTEKVVYRGPEIDFRPSLFRIQPSYSQDLKSKEAKMTGERELYVDGIASEDGSISVIAPLKHVVAVK